MFPYHRNENARQLGIELSPRLTKTLEFAEDPELLLDALRSFKDKVITTHLLRIRMKTISGTTFSPTTIESYARFAKDFELIVKLSERSGYRLTELGIHLINLMKKGMQNTKFKNALARVLLSNARKRHIFRKFLKFAESAPTKRMIWDEFNRPTGNVLINWCLAAGLVREHDDYVASTQLRLGRKHDDAEFWNVLSETFAEMGERSSPGMKRLYAKIREIRPKVTVKLDLGDHMEFDKHLERLLSNQHYRHRISLYGAPTGDLEDDRNVFVHDRKRYAYIEIRERSS